MTEQRDNGMDERETAGASAELLTFGRFSFDTHAYRLSRDGEDVHLTPKAAAVLCLLLQRPGELIGKDEFLETVWEGVFVREESLTQAISVIRQTLGDSAQAPQFIQTISGEGYRFIGKLAEGGVPSTGRPTGERPGTATPGALVAPTATPPGSAISSPVRAPRRMLIGGALAIAGLLIAAWILWPSVSPMATGRSPTANADASAPDEHRIVPMTSSPGPEWDPALSPDGRWLAFTQPDPEGGRRGLWVKMVDGGAPTQVISGETGSVYAPTWSPESDRIAFIRHDTETGRDVIVTISPLGDERRELCALDQVSHGALSWSPDAESMALVMRQPVDGPLRVFLLSLATCAQQPLTNPPHEWSGDWHPRFSPDGTSVAFVREEGLPTLQKIFVVPVQGGTEAEARPITSRVFNVQGMDWTADGQSLIFVDFTPGQSSEWGLWRIPVSGDSQPERVAISDGARSTTIARTANRLAYISDPSSSDIWGIPGPAVAARSSRNTQMAAGEDAGQPVCSSTRVEYHPHYSHDGRKIAVISHGSGKAEVWTCNADGSDPRRITISDGLTEMPRWAPDNDLLAYALMDLEVGTYEIWVVSNSAAGVPQRITDDPADERGPHWSRDGRALYFTSDRTGRYEVWMQPVEKGKPVGEPVRVTTNGGWWAREGPDGEYVYYTKPNKGQRVGIWRISVDGDQKEERVTTVGTGNNWEIFEGGIVYETGARPASVFELYDFATEQTVEIAPAEDIWGNVYLGVSVSPDGRWIVYTRGQGTAATDIMLVENFR